jgi:predicted DNA-binding transcriptional regulator AlpA
MTPTTFLIHALPFSDRRVCNRDEAASYVGVSAGKFDKMVADGTMPKPLRYDGVRRWDKSALDRAINELGGLPSAPRVAESGGSAAGHFGTNEWDEVVASAP